MRYPSGTFRAWQHRESSDGLMTIKGVVFPPQRYRLSVTVHLGKGS